MSPHPLAIVTASTNLDRSEGCRDSWRDMARDQDLPIIIVRNGPDAQGRQAYLGTVPAFRAGIDRVLASLDAEIICAFHDDFEIQENDWDQKVLRHFQRQPACGLAGFGGAIGLGAEKLYQVPYDPMQLARIGFRSNLHDAEVHGVRSLLTERVACLDGFSQIGRRAFWEGADGRTGDPAKAHLGRPWTVLDKLGVVHHFYDGMLGCLARRYNWEVWYLPIAGTHYGGRTAVGDPGYQEWAKTQTTEGDHGFWEQAHKIGYEHFRDVLPLRV
jgi:hypothetical protein